MVCRYPEEYVRKATSVMKLVEEEISGLDRNPWLRGTVETRAADEVTERV